MPTLVIRGGRVIDQTGERVADVVIGDDGRIAAVGRDLDGFVAVFKISSALELSSPINIIVSISAAA
jgi:dihydroorotase-like cyclic amidohydrolase